MICTLWMFKINSSVIELASCKMAWWTALAGWCLLFSHFFIMLMKNWTDRQGCTIKKSVFKQTRKKAKMFPIHAKYRPQYHNSLLSAELHAQIKQWYCTEIKRVFTSIALVPGYSKSMAWETRRRWLVWFNVDHIWSKTAFNASVGHLSPYKSTFQLSPYLLTYKTKTP